MNILQDILGLITKGKVKPPTDKDYMVVASYTDAQEILKPQPKMQANLVNLGALKKFVQPNITPTAYKVYTALISQTGTTAPTVVVLENTLGVDITWTYTSTGNYAGTIPSGTFTADAYLTTPSTAVQTAANNINYKVALRIDNSDVTYKTLVLTSLNCNSGNLVNSVLGNQPIEIRVYN